jgi:hypothetical protein
MLLQHTRGIGREIWLLLGSAAGGLTSRGARAVAMFSARLALAKSP